ncbi:hypothetical protein LIT25_10515 [Bacillus sp. F19]|nr:hypothetical protein LIT25_10515 [Bacillus sp. F19]
MQVKGRYSFRKNSIIYGKILEKSGDLAVIQIGDSKLKAMIDSSVPSSGTYWFSLNPVNRAIPSALD